MGAFGAFIAFASLHLLFLSSEFLYVKISKWTKTDHKIMQVTCKKCKIYKFLLSVQLTHKQVLIEKTKISDWQQVFTF